MAKINNSTTQISKHKNPSQDSLNPIPMSVVSSKKIGKLFLALVLTLALTSPGLAQQTSPETNTTPENPAENTNPSGESSSEGDRALEEGNTVLSLEGGKKLMEDANQAISSNNYDVAIKDLQKARQVFNQLTNFYLDLSKSFNGLDNRISEEQRRKAAESGQMRDEATYQLAFLKPIKR